MFEYMVDHNETGTYNFKINDEQPVIIDWVPMIKDIISDIKDDIVVGKIAAKFHNTLVNIILAIAEKIKLKKIILSGGCLQNAVLLEKTIIQLEKRGYKVYRHQRIPPNDGGISLGQVVIANQRLRDKV